uniref:Ovule protein n=1 Tax=Steinernema glaseri TaxID=37863 RepID=A0A1I7ZJK8_9BILA
MLSQFGRAKSEGHLCQTFVLQQTANPTKVSLEIEASSPKPETESFKDSDDESFLAQQLAALSIFARLLLSYKYFPRISLVCHGCFHQHTCCSGVFLPKLSTRLTLVKSRKRLQKVRSF